MQMRRLAIMLFCLLPMSALMYGCGSTSKEGSAVSGPVKVDEASCAQCHAQAVDSIEPSTTIYAKYNQSLHFTNNFHTVGCQDCHGGGSQHNGVGPIQYANPDAAGQCFSCHKNYLPTAHYASYPANATSTYNDSGAAHSAQYVSTNYKNSCTSCHDSHQPKVGKEHTDWAESGHGDINGAAWQHYDFKFNADCISCHTSTGFISYVTSGYTKPTTTTAAAGDSSHEVLTCKACHTDYNFKNRVRNAGAVKAYGYTYNGAAITFASVGKSNLCVTCHSGRGNTQSARSTRYQGHHAPAAGILFNDKSHMGYEFTGKAYTNSVVFAHGKVGTSSFPTTGDTGPCVACHMDATNNTSSHKFEAVTKNTAGNITALPTQTMCANCHNTTGFVAAVEAKRVGYIEAGQLLKAYLDNTVTNYLAAKVDLTKIASKTTDGSAYIYADNVYGAFQNFLMGGDGTTTYAGEEKGAYVHNSAYAKRLLFDSIDWMANGAFTGSITIPAGYPNARVWFGADGAGVATRP